jgi:hypothetical protein
MLLEDRLAFRRVIFPLSDRQTFLDAVDLPLNHRNQLPGYRNQAFDVVMDGDALSARRCHSVRDESRRLIAS